MEVSIDCSRGRLLPKKAVGTPCEYVLNNQKHRCSAFIYLTGKDPQSKEEWKDEARCIDEWQAVLLIEGAQTNRGQTAALESLRNEMVKGQETFNKLIGLKDKMLEG